MFIMLKLIFPLLKTKIYRRFNRQTVPYKINLHITYSCNLRCRTCFIWNKYNDDPSLKKKELNTNQWKTFFEKLGERIYWLSISGGEPFLRDDIVEIISSINMKNLCIFSINTNGQLSEKIYDTMRNVLNILPKNVKVFLAVSLLGLENTHNFISGKKNTSETSNRTYKKLKSLQAKHKNFHLERELVVNKHNLDEIPEIVDKLNKDKIPFTLTFAQESEYYGNVGKDVNFSPQERKRIAGMLKNMNIYVYQKEDIVRKVFKKIAINFFERGKIPKCYSSWSSIRIDPYGNVYPCIMKNEIIGNVVGNSMDIEKTILNSKNIQKIQSEIKSGKCSCWTPCEAYQNIIQNLKFI